MWVVGRSSAGRGLPHSLSWQALGGQDGLGRGLGLVAEASVERRPSLGLQARLAGRKRCGRRGNGARDVMKSYGVIGNVRELRRIMYK